MYIYTYKRAGVRVYVPDLFSIRWCFVQSLKAICTRSENRAENKTPTGCFTSLFPYHFFLFFFSLFSPNRRNDGPRDLSCTGNHAVFKVLSEPIGVT